VRERAEHARADADELRLAHADAERLGVLDDDLQRGRVGEPHAIDVGDGRRDGERLEQRDSGKHAVAVVLADGHNIDDATGDRDRVLVGDGAADARGDARGDPAADYLGHGCADARGDRAADASDAIDHGRANSHAVAVRHTSRQHVVHGRADAIVVSHAVFVAEL